MVAYATRADVYRYGLPRGTLGHSARELASVVADSDVLELDGHGFEDDDQVLVRAVQDGTLAAPLVAGTTYYVRRLTDATFKLSATPGGSAIDLTTNGVGMVVSVALPIDEVLEFYSRFVDGYIPHGVPLTAPYPIEIVATVAELAAKKLLALAGHASVSVGEYEAAAHKRLERWAKGVAIRDPAVTASTNKAVVATVAASASDPRGWGSGTLP